MKAIVYFGPGDIRLEEMRDPDLEAASDAIVRLTASAICGFDLQIARGSVPQMRPGTILGHEAVGVIEDLGEDIRNFEIGDRVLLCPTLACGACRQCRRGHYAHCTRANPNGPSFGAAMFGGPAPSGPFHGLQAEYARVPFAHTTLLHLPESLSDADGLALTDAIPTGLFAIRLTQLRPGQSLAVFGCGPVGQQAIAFAQRIGAGRIFAIDRLASRLEAARARGAEAIDLEREDPVEVIDRLTQGEGVDCVIDAVPIDALPSRLSAPTELDGNSHRQRNGTTRDRLLPLLETLRSAELPLTDASEQAFEWSCAVAGKSGTLAILCFQPGQVQRFSLASALQKNLTLRLGTCHHRKYLPRLIEKSQTRRVQEHCYGSRALEDEPLELLSMERSIEQRFFDLSPWE
ncbi:MAG: alcohol dehydrogenase catalytic domain-containing protein [Myxococcales bacterium]|jgi:threonine dehydrogenase-like Zn-dependent dehydrogenase|nr:alcohol dehydrogenase catalytic domain-containing protein [Myxococcales bacterium]